MTETIAGAAVRDNTELSRYELLLDDQVAGFSAYQLSDDRLILAHVEIAPDCGGRGLASKLVSQQLDDAARRRLRVVPVCPFVRKVITDHPEKYLCLVPGDELEQLGLPRSAK